MRPVRLVCSSAARDNLHRVVIMSILVATDREVIDVERASASGTGSATVLLASLRTRSLTDGHGVGLTGAVCSGAMTADGPGGLSASRAG